MKPSQKSELCFQGLLDKVKSLSNDDKVLTNKLILCYENTNRHFLWSNDFFQIVEKYMQLVSNKNDSIIYCVNEFCAQLKKYKTNIPLKHLINSDASKFNNASKTDQSLNITSSNAQILCNDKKDCLNSIKILQTDNDIRILSAPPSSTALYLDSEKSCSWALQNDAINTQSKIIVESYSNLKNIQISINKDVSVNNSTSAVKLLSPTRLSQTVWKTNSDDINSVALNLPIKYQVNMNLKTNSGVAISNCLESEETNILNKRKPSSDVSQNYTTIKKPRFYSASKTVSTPTKAIPLTTSISSKSNNELIENSSKSLLNSNEVIYVDDEEDDVSFVLVTKLAASVDVQVLHPAAKCSQQSTTKVNTEADCCVPVMDSMENKLPDDVVIICDDEDDDDVYNSNLQIDEKRLRSIRKCISQHDSPNAILTDEEAIKKFNDNDQIDNCNFQSDSVQTNKNNTNSIIDFNIDDVICLDNDDILQSDEVNLNPLNSTLISHHDYLKKKIVCDLERSETFISDSCNVEKSDNLNIYDLRNCNQQSAIYTDDQNTRFNNSPPHPLLLFVNKKNLITTENNLLVTGPKCKNVAFKAETTKDTASFSKLNLLNEDDVINISDDNNDVENLVRQSHIVILADNSTRSFADKNAIINAANIITGKNKTLLSSKNLKEFSDHNFNSNFGSKNIMASEKLKAFDSNSFTGSLPRLNQAELPTFTNDIGSANLGQGDDGKLIIDVSDNRESLYKHHTIKC